MKKTIVILFVLALAFPAFCGSRLVLTYHDKTYEVITDKTVSTNSASDVAYRNGVFDAFRATMEKSCIYTIHEELSQKKEALGYEVFPSYTAGYRDFMNSYGVCVSGGTFDSIYNYYASLFGKDLSFEVAQNICYYGRYVFVNKL